MDVERFEAWYEQEHPRLVSAMLVIARDVSSAVEAADEAFVRAYERWDRVGPMVSPGGWTYRTALNVLRRHYRRSGLERRLLLRRATADRLERSMPAPPADWSPEIWEALGNLPGRERTAMALRYMADLSTTAIADAMGIAEGTVGSTLHAARQRLATLLSDGEGRRATPSTATGTTIRTKRRRTIDDTRADTGVETGAKAETVEADTSEAETETDADGGPTGPAGRTQLNEEEADA